MDPKAQTAPIMATQTPHYSTINNLEENRSLWYHILVFLYDLRHYR
jgi:hypothetical protein